MELQELENRLDVLLEQEVIVDHVYAVTIAAYKKVLNLLNIERLEQGEMLFTHLPLALTRIENGEKVEGPDTGMMEEVENSAIYSKAKKLLDFVEHNWGEALPQEEKDFLTLHFANLLNNNERSEVNMKIVIGGQVEKKEIDRLVKDFDDSIETVIKSDMDGAMLIKSGQADYYLGACHTGGGGALAMTIAIAGRDVCETVSMPGRKPNEQQIIQAVKDGKKAFGFTGDHAETAVPMILKALRDYG